MGPDENLWKKSSQLQGSQRAPRGLPSWIHRQNMKKLPDRQPFSGC